MASLFDNQKQKYGIPEDGSKISFERRTKFAFYECVIENEKLLQLHKEYTILKTELNSSSSYVWLEEFGEDVFFNLHSFEKV